MKKKFFVAFSFLLVLIGITCFVSKQEEKKLSKKEEKIIATLPYDIYNKENNYAFLFTMTNEEGRKESIDMMQSVFKDGNLGFQVEAFHNKSSKEIYEKITNICKKIDNDGTLLLYFNSHGGGEGKYFSMTAAGGDLKFSKVLESIKKGKKVKRLIVLVDTCHAEGAINEGFEGGAKLLKNIKTGLAEFPTKCSEKETPFFDFFEKDGEMKYGEDDKAYDELLVICSVNATNLSTRTEFPIRFKKAYAYALANKKISNAQFLKKFADLFSDLRQQPMYKIIPESMLDEPLFESLPAKEIPVVDQYGEVFNKDYILLPN